MKIVTIVGARPQFIKVATVSRAISKFRELREVIVHTGQHYDENMSKVFFDELDIPRPDYNLNIGGGTHGQNTGRMIEKIEEVLLAETPDWVLVYGDTDSTLAGALAAAKLHIPIAHVEAGLRSYNRRMPEEINRVVTDHVAHLLFTPTVRATQNLIGEGLQEDNVHQVGDVMYDAALFYGEQAEHKSHILASVGLKTKSFILATIHRAENTDEKRRLNGIVQGFQNAPFPIVWPLHPRTAKQLRSFGIDLPSTIKIIEPVGYLDMVMLEKHAALIATDSGGVQKEAYFHRVPCITLRDETEWVELVELGANRLSAPDSESIGAKLNDIDISFPAHIPLNIYGHGDAGDRIARMLCLNVSPPLAN